MQLAMTEVADVSSGACPRRPRPGPGRRPPPEFELAPLAVRAGAVLMDHYERLERIDYKSARDVVTEGADHLSEALILDAIRASYPADAILAEETGSTRRKWARRFHLGAWPSLDRRSARRDGELRQRPACLLCPDRVGRGCCAVGRGDPGPDPERGVRCDPRRRPRDLNGARSVPQERTNSPTS